MGFETLRLRDTSARAKDNALRAPGGGHRLTIPSTRISAFTIRRQLTAGLLSPCLTLDTWHAFPMYIRRLVCQNVRSFAEIDLDLCPMYEGSSRIERRREIEALSLIENLLEPDGDVGRSPFPGWTVVTGDNGAGKSTILTTEQLLREAEILDGILGHHGDG